MSYDHGPRNQSSQLASQIADLLKELPNLENFGFSIDGLCLELPPNSCITHLSATVNTAALTPLENRFEMFDNVTHLALNNYGENSVITTFPKFRNLTTLEMNLIQCYGQELLDHFVTYNPRLVNLYLDFRPTVTPLLERLHTCDTIPSDIENILPTAPKLCSFLLALEASLENRHFSLDWLADAVEAGTCISPDLNLIQVSLIAIQEVLLRDNARNFPLVETKYIISPVVAFGHETPMLIIDLRAMEKWAKGRRDPSNALSLCLLL